MELALNLGWLLLALLLYWQWLRHTPPAHTSRGVQLVALTMLVLILFPVISVTDDLQATQNPAEIERTLRRDDHFVHPHTLLPVVASLPPLAFAGIPLTLLYGSAPGPIQVFVPVTPEQVILLNRPPPCA
jgi:hypothetical protein